MNDTVPTLKEQQDAALRFLKFAMTHKNTPEHAAKEIAVAVNEIESTRNHIILLQTALARANGHIEQIKDVLGAYERWEADLMRHCESWIDGLPLITQEFRDRLAEIGEARGAVIRTLRG